MHIGKYQTLTKHSEDIVGEIHRIAGGDDEAAGFIKILRDEFVRDADLVLTFHRCAKSCCSISSPYALRATEHGQENGVHYIVYEKTNLKPLTDVIASDNIISTYEATAVIERIAELLRIAHLDGVTHGTLVPANIFSSGTLEEFRLANFGFESFYYSLYKKRYKKLRKDLPFFPPEFYANTGLERPSDIFALNVLYYKLLVGEILWKKEDFYFFSKGERSLIPPSLQKLEIPDYVDNVVLKALAARIEDRYTSLSQFVADLSEVKSRLLASLTPTTALLQELASFDDKGNEPPAVEDDLDDEPELENGDEDDEDEGREEDTSEPVIRHSAAFVEEDDALDLDSLIEAELDQDSGGAGQGEAPQTNPKVPHEDFVDQMLSELGRPPTSRSIPTLPDENGAAREPRASETGFGTEMLQNDALLNTDGESLLDRTDDETNEFHDTDTISDISSGEYIHQLQLIEFDGLSAVWPFAGVRAKKQNNTIQPDARPAKRSVRDKPRLVNGTTAIQKLQPPFQDEDVVETETLATTRTLDVRSRYPQKQLPAFALVLLPLVLIMAGLFAADVFWDINPVNSLIRQRVTRARMENQPERAQTQSGAAEVLQDTRSRMQESDPLAQSTQNSRAGRPASEFSQERNSLPQQRNARTQSNDRTAAGSAPLVASREPIVSPARASVQLLVYNQNEPQVSEVYLNGTRYGSTDNAGYLLLENLEVNRRHLLRIQKPGFEIWSTNIFYETGGNQYLNVQLQRSRQISSFAADDESDVTETLNPSPLDTARGRAQPVMDQGANSQNPPASGRREIEGTLRIHLLNTEDIRDAFIFINGLRWDGEDDTAPAEIKLSPGNYSIEVRKDGYNSAPIVQSINLSAGETRGVEFLLTPL